MRRQDLTAAAACLGLLATALATGCGETPVKITSTAPLYALVSRNGDLAVDVIDQSSYAVVGSILVASGGGGATGAVAATPGGHVVVTYTGVQVGSDLTVKPGTVACSLDSSQCDSLWSGWGSATAISLQDSSVAVPGWNDVDFTKGRLAIFGGSSLGMRRQLSLGQSVPGPIAVSPDGSQVYWLTYAPIQGNQRPQQELLRLDAGTAAVQSTVALGQRLGFGLTVDGAGGVLMSVVDEHAPDQSSPGAPPTGQVYGTTVLVFSPDLSTSRSITVGPEPTFVAAGAGTVMVASSGAALPFVGVYDEATGKALGSLTIPVGWKLEGLQVVTIGGRPAGTIELNELNRGRYRIGVVDLATAAVTWHEYAGASLGSVAA